MSNVELLSDKVLIARITNLEYENLSPEKIEEEIKKIYLEETGMDFPVNLEAYTSDDVLKGIRDFDRDSGFDGAILHLYSQESQINQVITIARGSEMGESDDWRPLDWTYNLTGLFAGKTIDQNIELDKFYDSVKSEIMKVSENNQLPPHKQYAYGHSLGGGLITTNQLLTNRFDSIYLFNAAKPSYHQLDSLDENFRDTLRREFNLKGPDDITSIPQQEIKTFTEKYFLEERGIDESSIQHIVMEEDFLNSITNVPGFIDIGEKQYLNHHAEYKDFSNLMANIPEDVVNSIRGFLSPYALTYADEGFDSFIKELTGFNPSVVDQISSAQQELSKLMNPYQSLKDKTHDRLGSIPTETFWDKIRLPGRFMNSMRLIPLEWAADNMVSRFRLKYHSIMVSALAIPMLFDMASKIPKLLGFIQDIYKYLPEITEALVAEDIMTKEEQKLLLQTIEEIERDLKSISVLLFKALISKEEVLPITLIGLFNMTQLGKHINSLFENMNLLKNTEWKFIDYFGVAVEAHSLDAVIEALEMEKLREENTLLFAAGLSNAKEAFNMALQSPSLGYLGKARVSIKSKSGSPIVIHLSSAMNIYKKGRAILDEKRTTINRMKKIFEQEIINDYEEKKSYLRRKMNEMEESPIPYRYIIEHLAFPGFRPLITSLRVNIDFSPIPNSVFTNFEETISQLEEEIMKEEELINDIRVAIETIFEKEWAIAKTIQLSR